MLYTNCFCMIGSSYKQFSSPLHHPEHVFFHSGSAQQFRKNFELPIIKGRDADAGEKVRERGNQKLQEVSSTWGGGWVFDTWSALSPTTNIVAAAGFIRQSLSVSISETYCL